MVVYCETKGRAVIRLSDHKQIAWCYDKRHAKAVAQKFNAWYNLGWPYKLEEI